VTRTDKNEERCEIRTVVPAYLSEAHSGTLSISTLRNIGSGLSNPEGLSVGWPHRHTGIEVAWQEIDLEELFNIKPG